MTVPKPDFAIARRAMLDSQLRTSGVSDRAVLSAMGRLPRELFVPQDRRAVAYIDDMHRLGGHGSSRFMPPPAIFARLAQLAAIGPEDRVLDVGAGTGYSTAVLAAVAAHVQGVETEAAFAQQARANLAELGIENASVTEQLPDTAVGAFDVVLFQGALEAVDAHWLALLADGGRLVALVQNGGVGLATVFSRQGASVTSRSDFNANLPLLFARQHREEFVF